MALPTTMPDAIKLQEERIINYRILNKYTKMHNIETDDNLIIPIDSIVNKYRNFLEDSVKTAKMTDEEWFTYRLRPKSLSLRLYGTTEFWHVLLLLNGCKSTIDFDLKTVKYYDRRTLYTKLNEILIIEGVL